jgi:hypothetical protein
MKDIQEAILTDFGLHVNLRRSTPGISAFSGQSYAGA